MGGGGGSASCSVVVGKEFRREKDFTPSFSATRFHFSPPQCNRTAHVVLSVETFPISPQPPNKDSE